MKMKYHLKNREKGKGFFLPVFILFLLFILTALFFPNILPGKINSLAKPVWLTKNILGQRIGEMASLLNAKSDLVMQNIELKKEISNSENIRIRNIILEKENADLKKLLGIKTNESYISARVLSKDSQSPYGTIIIDTGKKNIAKGNEVYAEGILIGLIDEVYSDTAKVRLLSASGNKFKVEIGETAIEGIAEGLGGGDFQIELPRGIDVNIGDEIISADLNLKLLGFVEYIDQEERSSFQKILFKTPVNINQLKWVEIKNE